MTERHDADVTLELFVRWVGPGPGSPAEHVLEALEDLEAQGAIAAYTVTVCGKSIPASVDDAMTSVGERLADRAATLERWAAHNDRRLVGVFEEVSSCFSDRGRIDRRSIVLGEIDQTAENDLLYERRRLGIIHRNSNSSGRK